MDIQYVLLSGLLNEAGWVMLRIWREVAEGGRGFGGGRLSREEGWKRL